MNLLFLVVWLVFIISHAVSVPRHQLRKYPVTKSQTSYRDSHEATALEVLERKFSQPNKRNFKHNLHKKRRVLHEQNLYQSTPTTANITIKDVYRALNRDRSVFESCFASFGDQSPLCKTQPIRQRRPRQSKISYLHKKQIESENSVQSNTNEDFFGLFKTSSEAPTEKTSKVSIQKRTVPELNVMISKSTTSMSDDILTTNGSDTVPTTFIQDQTIQSSTPAITIFDTGNFTTLQCKPTSKVNEEISKGPLSLATLHTTSQLVFSNDDVKKDIYKESEHFRNIPHMLYLNQVVAKQENRNMLHKINEDSDETPLVTEETTTGEDTEDTVTEMEDTPKSDFRYAEPIQKQKSILDSLDSYNREECERDNKKVCVCSFESLKLDFSKIFSKLKSTRTVMEEISHYECRHFVPLPEQFTLSSNAKPTVLSANHKPMFVDNENGPKEIDEKSMDEFVAQSVSEEDELTHVFVNSDVEIPCFPSHDLHLSTSEADHVTYKWTFGNNKAITEGRITENSDGEGSLSLTEVNAGDSREIYTCQVEYINPDTGHHAEETFEHVLNVVALPTVTVRLALHYRGSGACDPGVVQMFKLYMPQQLQDSLCKIAEDRHVCKVEVHSTVCRTESAGESRDSNGRRRHIKKLIWPRPKRQASMEMSLNYEIFIHRVEEKLLSSENSSLCHAECHLYVTLKLLRLLKDSFTQVVNIPVASETQSGTENFYPVQSSQKVKYIFGCMGGYHLKDGFCAACPEHTFSNDGDTECTPCPPHSYQGKLGARKCIPCTNHWIPACNQYIEDTNIFIVVAVLVTLSVTIAVFGCIYYIRVKEKSFSHMTKKVVPFSPKKFTSKSKEAKKSSKRVHFKTNHTTFEPESSEMQSFLDSSSDDDSRRRLGYKDPPLTSDDDTEESIINDSGKIKKMEDNQQDISSKKNKMSKKK